MNFLYPGFLFALFAAAIPVIIHLFNFRKFKKVNFSNVAFIREIEERNASREKLKNLLVLAARILSIVFLVLAFARPFINSGQSPGPDEGISVSIYIDNSYSMDAVNKDGSLLDEAKRRAKEIAASYNLNDRFQLLTNDFEGAHQRLLSREAFISAVDEVKISAAGRTLQQVLNRQQAVFSGRAARQLYILSDFQQTFTGTKPMQTEAGTRGAFVKLQANPQPNVAIDSVWTEVPVHRPAAAEMIIVRVRNYGTRNADHVPLRLLLNGTQKAVSSLTVPAEKSITDTLSFSGPGAGWQRGELIIKDFPITFDDRFLFTFEVKSGQSVLQIQGRNAGSQISALLAAEPFFKTAEVSEAAINVADFNIYSLVVLNGVQQPSDGLAIRLRDFVAQGGSLLLIPAADAAPQTYNGFLRALKLPGFLSVDTSSTRVTAINLRHPLFSNVFDAVPRNMSLPEIKGFFQLENTRMAREDVLTMPGNRPAFSVFPQGSGRVYLSLVSPDPKAGDFYRHPVVVPMLLNTALAAGHRPALYYTLGRDATLPAPPVTLSEKNMPKLVSGTTKILPELQRQAGHTSLYIADQARKQDFYTLRRNTETLAAYAFNTGRNESDMRYADNETLRRLGNNNKIQLIDMRNDSLSAGIADQNNRTELWKLCLILALAFIAAEIVLIRFLNHSGNKKAS
ncbi:BatA and WFA domain-containing protein [Pedobacter sp. SYP-B3415]|uniref:vWA domain-containing protein n=1 Tax=Pedobacter sp. SYP-B3415 TaxID=2496641 RepID=UPI0013EE278C|nr:BatA and WFA domain-containing protein [Pedobacter sp. SYP-B3415]